MKREYEILRDAVSVILLTAALFGLFRFFRRAATFRPEVCGSSVTETALWLLGCESEPVYP